MSDLVVDDEAAFWEQAVGIADGMTQPSVVDGVRSGDADRHDEEPNATSGGPVKMSQVAASTDRPAPDDRTEAKRHSLDPKELDADPANDAATSADWSYTSDPAYAASRFGGIADYLRNKRVKLQVQNDEVAKSMGGGKPQIFKGVAVYINGHVQPSLQTLRDLLVSHGGTYIPYLDRKSLVTHIVASNLTPSKFREFAAYKVATPEWIVKSIEVGRKLDWREFKLVAGGGVEEELRGGMQGFLKPNASTKPSNMKAPLAASATTAVGDGVDPAQGRTIIESSYEALSSSKPLTNDKRSRSPSALQPRTTSASTPLSELAPAPASTSAALSTLPHADIETAHTHSPLIKTGLSLRAPSEMLVPSQIIPSHPGARDRSPSAPPSSSTGHSALPPPPGLLSSTDPISPQHAEATNAFHGYAANASNLPAQRLMREPGWRKQHTAANEGFLDGYYAQSRLHHLSTWKAELKVLVAEAQRRFDEAADGIVDDVAPGARVPAEVAGGLKLSLRDAALPRLVDGQSPTGMLVRPAPNGGSERVIFHVDFDAFFVSCSLDTRPELKGLPTVVCHSQGQQGGGASTSEIASCSYEARAMGVRNGMSLGQARRLCPEVKTLPYEFETYKKFSLAFYTILVAYADELQAVSVDEALLDVTSRVRAIAEAPQALEDDGEGDPARALAERIRRDVRAATRCEVSIGISSNILLARIATRKAKPANSFHLRPVDAPTLLADLDVGDLPGFGWAACKKIAAEFGSTRCGQLLQFPRRRLQSALGEKTGGNLYDFIRGIDGRQIESDKERKSVSAEVNYGIRFETGEEAEKFLVDLSGELAKRLRNVSRTGRQLTLKIMVRHPEAPREAPKFMGHGYCVVHNKSLALDRAIDDQDGIADAILKLYRPQGLDPVELRGIGIQMSKLEGGRTEAAPPGQAKLSFGARTPVKAPMERRQQTQVVESSDDDDVQLVSATKPGPSKAKSSALPPVATGFTRFGRPPAKRKANSSIPDPAEIDPETWQYVDDDTRRVYLAAWAQQGLDVPQALGGKGNKRVRPAQQTLDVMTTPTKKAKRVQAAVAAAASSAAKVERPTEETPCKVPERSPPRPTPITVGSTSTPQLIPTPISVPSSSSTPVGLGSRFPSSQINALGIDVDVFRGLPSDIQREAITGEQLRTTLRRPGNRGTIVSPLRKQVGVHATATVYEGKPLTAAAATRPSMNKQTSLPDVLAMITDWMQTRGGEVPIEGEVRGLRKYLLKCLERETSSLGGVENATHVLVWWRRACKGLTAEPEVKSAWQAAFRSVREDIDAACRKRFGAGLRLPK